MEQIVDGKSGNGDEQSIASDNEGGEEQGPDS